MLRSKKEAATATATAESEGVGGGPGEPAELGAAGAAAAVRSLSFVPLLCVISFDGTLITSSRSVTPVYMLIANATAQPPPRRRPGAGARHVGGRLAGLGDARASRIIGFLPKLGQHNGSAESRRRWVHLALSKILADFRERPLFVVDNTAYCLFFIGACLDYAEVEKVTPGTHAHPCPFCTEQRTDQRLDRDLKRSSGGIQVQTAAGLGLRRPLAEDALRRKAHEGADGVGTTAANECDMAGVAAASPSTLWWETIPQPIRCTPMPFIPDPLHFCSNFLARVLQDAISHLRANSPPFSGFTNSAYVLAADVQRALKTANLRRVLRADISGGT